LDKRAVHRKVQLWKWKFRQTLRLVSAPLILLNVSWATWRGVAVLFSSLLYIRFAHIHKLPTIYLFFDEADECGEVFPTLLIYFWT
jgi:hypothetical protein